MIKPMLMALGFVLIATSANAATVSSRSGVRVRVAPAAQARLQCVVSFVEHAGIHITSMRGFGKGTVRHSLHPSGRALDINQTDRNRTHPRVPQSVSNGAADACGVISGARWHYADNGHFNLETGERIFMARRNHHRRVHYDLPRTHVADAADDRLTVH